MQFAHLIGMLVLAFLSNSPAHAEGRQFVGSTPCGAEPRQFLGISPSLPCERIDWHLAFAENTARSTFDLRIVYGMGAPNEPGFKNGGSAKTVTGTWSREASDRRLTVRHGAAVSGAANSWRRSASPGQSSMAL